MSLAVLAGDEQKVASLLANHPSTLQERNLFGQTPLHLGAGQPACLRLLLQGPGRSLLEQPDFNGYTALQYAAYKCTELCKASVVVILESDCKLANEYSQFFAWLCRNCRGEVLRHIKNRRERLKRYALQRLPDAEAASFGLHRASVLDSKANHVTQALERRGFEIPSPLRLDVCFPTGSPRLDEGCDRYRPVSMFHQSPLNSPFGADLERIFRLGFRDFDSPLGISPLLSWLSTPHYVNNFKLGTSIDSRYKACIWLMEHGANLWDTIPGDRSATTAHYLYYSIGLDLGKVMETTKSKIQFLMRVLSTCDVRDDCRCKCCPGGCSPFVWFLRATIYVSIEEHDASNHKKKIIDNFVDFLIQWTPTITLEQLQSAIRYLTFEILEIRHTCFRKKYDSRVIEWLTDDDIDELMGEDSTLLELLEELVREFDLELQTHIAEEDPLGLCFWKTYWPEHMEEVTRKLDGDRMNEDELLATQQLGVTWHHLEDSPAEHQRKRRACVPYRESDWSVEVDDVEMWDTLRSMGDWRSRLDLIMSRAIPDWR